MPLPMAAINDLTRPADNSRLLIVYSDNISIDVDDEVFGTWN